MNTPSPSPASGWEAERERLRKALKDITDRFERALIGTGTDPEYAAIACAEARAALSESEQTTADGWMLVPREPTEAMNVAGCKEDDILGELVDWRGENTTTRETVARVYRAMIAAAPVTP